MCHAQEAHFFEQGWQGCKGNLYQKKKKIGLRGQQV